jgi:hypothetical protein
METPSQGLSARLAAGTFARANSKATTSHNSSDADEQQDKILKQPMRNHASLDILQQGQQRITSSTG